MSIAKLFGVALVFVASLTVAAQCSSAERHLHVRQQDGERLQNLVNAGHEPWRLDAEAVASEYFLTLEKTPKDAWDVYGQHPSTMSDGREKAEYRFVSAIHPNKTYYITVRRFDYLLPLARRWDWVVWIVTDAKVVSCHSEPAD